MGATVVMEDCLMAMAMIVIGNHVFLGVKTTQGVLLEAKKDPGSFEFRFAAWSGERRFVFLAPGEDGMVLMPSPA
jgi:hypothetical protein